MKDKETDYWALLDHYNIHDTSGKDFLICFFSCTPLHFFQHGEHFCFRSYPYLDCKSHEKAYSIASKIFVYIRTIVYFLEKPNYYFYPLVKDTVKICKSSQKIIDISLSDNSKHRGISIDSSIEIPIPKRISANTPHEKWLTLALNNRAVGDVFELYSKQDEQFWRNASNIVEVILDQKYEIPLGMKRKINNLLQTSQSPDVVGIGSSRHGVSRNKPPKDPTNLKDAKVIISELITSWVHSMIK